jgi:hypothetical protein
MRCKECGREFFPIRKECEILLRHLSSAGISETKKETRLEENGAFGAPFSAPPTAVDPEKRRQHKGLRWKVLKIFVFETREPLFCRVTPGVVRYGKDNPNREAHMGHRSLYTLVTPCSGQPFFVCRRGDRDAQR